MSRYHIVYYRINFSLSWYVDNFLVERICALMNQDLAWDNDGIEKRFILYMLLFGGNFNFHTPFFMVVYTS